VSELLCVAWGGKGARGLGRATLQKASTTSLLVSFLSLINASSSVASYRSVISSSFVLKIPHRRGISRTLVSSPDGLKVAGRSQLLGMREACSVFFRSLMDCHDSFGAGA